MRAAKQSGGVRRRLRWTTLYALLLAAYSVFALLDAFVIPKDIVYAEEIAGVQEGERRRRRLGRRAMGRRRAPELRALTQLLRGVMPGVWGIVPGVWG